MIIIPRLSEKQLIAKFRKTANKKGKLNYLDPAYRSQAFIKEERGKTFEVATWALGRSVATKDVRQHFLDQGDFKGNAVAFIAWVIKRYPGGYYFTSIPDKDRLLGGKHGVPCAPYFHRGSVGCRLRLVNVTDAWGADCVFVAFREVN